MEHYKGLRVLRGPDWEGGDGDGGEGYLGTVVQVFADHTVSVLWDVGQESVCWAGKDGKFELRVFDTAPVGIRHPSTNCAGCGENDIHGMLWRCRDCSGCDLCPLCYSDDKHDLRHQFLRIDRPDAEGQPLSKRKSSVKVRAIGIHPRAKVVRGKHWEWGDQDGGEGSEGEVKSYENNASASDSSRSMVRVEWPHGVVHSYRLGYHGNVDLRCVEEEVGSFYYRDHLPLLDTTESSTIINRKSTVPTTQDNSSKILEQISPSNGHVLNECASDSASALSQCITEKEETVTLVETKEEEELSVTEGDRVAIKVGDEKLKELQQHCGGCTARMVRCIGRTGEVTAVSAKGIVAVKFGSTKVNYRFNPHALLKVDGSFSVDDVVRIREDIDLLKVLNTRVGWRPYMDKTANKTGRVVKVDDDGDVRVDFKGLQYTYAPASCLYAAAGATEDSLDSAGAAGGESQFQSEIGNPADQTEGSSENAALFRKMRDLVLKESGKSQTYSMRSLYAAIELDADDSIRDMCQQDPTMVEREYQGITPLIYASLRGKHRCVETLLDLGADVNRAPSDDHKKTPMSAVLEGKSEQIAEVLLSRGADTTHLYGDGHTMAHMAVLKEKPVILRALAKHGADLNAKDDNEDTPLHLAIELRRHVVMEVLVDCPQADIHIGNTRDFDMVQLACYVDNPRALEKLLARDSSGTERLREGHSTALHIAATNDHVECVRLLIINGGADPNTKGKDGQTALHIASHRALIPTVEALLELGAEVNIDDKDGDTPLHLAIGGKVEGYRGRTEELVTACRIQISTMLISSGAFVDAEDHRGRHPFNYGRTTVRKGIRAFMQHNKHIVRVKSGRTADDVAQSFGISNPQGRGGGQLREALKDVGLPCGVCGTPKSDTTLQPCQHKCVCSNCSGKVVRCPLCDEEIKDRIFTGQDGQTVDAEACKQM